MVLAVMFIVCGLFGGISEYGVAFSSNCEGTTATVQEVIEYRSKQSTTHRATVTYCDDSYQYYTVEISIPNSTNTGDSVPVLYSKDQPDRVDYGTRAYHRKRFFLMSILFVGGILMAIRSKRSIKRYTQEQTTSTI